MGANVGFYTLLAAVMAGTSGRVHAFEPLPRNVALLRRHLRLNHIQTVDIREVAVSDATGLATFEDGLPPADVIKMDIEGGELRELRGAGDLLAAGDSMISLSTHETRGPRAVPCLAHGSGLWADWGR